MKNKYHTVIIGGGCLGAACAFSIQRKLGIHHSQIAIVEKKVLGAGLSSRHSAIVRAANTSKMAARMAKQSIELWKNLKSIWGVEIDYEQSGAIWITDSNLQKSDSRWQSIETSMREESIEFNSIPYQEIRKLSKSAIKTSPDELYYYESEVLQFESAQILNGIQNAVKKNGIAIYEHCEVMGFEQDCEKQLSAVNTSQGKIYADHFVNASGPWCTELFYQLGLTIPVALEPVYVANFLVSCNEIPKTMPIIADYCNDVYFRRWQGNFLHMHQPRNTHKSQIAKSFSRSTMNPDGANIIYDAMSFNLNHHQLEAYIEKINHRFPNLGKPVYAGGYQSFFDITPDLQFILGPDTSFPNLFHCLGAGQGLKYAPLFGELIAELILDRQALNLEFDSSEFAISRFNPAAAINQTQNNKLFT